MSDVSTVAAGALAQAYAACEALARSHYENFPVASMLLPRAMRPHVAAVYAFARKADDMADEGTAPGAARRAALDDWLRRLHEAVRTGVRLKPDATNGTDADDLMLLATAHSIRTLDLPLSLFDDLVSAFAQDTMTTRYASWDDVLDYCRRSANPVGRLVLRIAGHRDPRLDRSSDALCTALQLTNFWQDFGRDWRNGRLYVPRDVQHAEGVDESQLSNGTLTDGWARAIERCVAFTRQRFADGRAVCDGVRGRLRAELRFTWLGGARILERVERGRFTLLRDRPALNAWDVPVLLLRAALWTPTPIDR
ncbi:MAG TPA: squalene synthase HpnC [Vicinamibacterales bacterium]|nr:squalene synthase HpnC [Vicinamibacterales bacterium]